MHRYILLMMLFPALLSAQSLTDTEVAEKVFRDGLRFENEGNWSEALRHYEYAVDRAPDVVSYRYRAALAASFLADYESAGTFIRPVLSKRHVPSLILFADVLLEQAYLLFKKGELKPAKHELEQARGWYRKADHLEPNRPTPDADFGLARCAEIEWEIGGRQDNDKKLEAASYYLRYLGSGPNGKKRTQAAEKWREFEYEEHGKALNFAIRVFEGAHEDELEEKRAEELLLDLTPKLKDAYYWLGLLVVKRDVVRAYNYWTEALQSETVRPMAQHELAKLLIKREKHKKALDLLRESFDKAPHLIEVALDMGRLYFKQGKVDDAKYWFKYVTENAPDRIEAETALKELRRIKGVPTVAEIKQSTRRLTEANLKDLYGEEVDAGGVQRRLTSIVEQLRKGTPGLGRFHIHLLDGKGYANAHVLPPNHIYITRPLIDDVDNMQGLSDDADDVWAFILAHEIAHLNHRDAEMLEDLPTFNEGAVQNLQFFRRMEKLADRYGVLMMYRAKFDPLAAVKWCRANGASPSGKSHPTYDARRDALETFISRDLTDAYNQFEAGVKRFQADDFVGAIDAFDNYISFVPNDIEARYNFAQAAFQQAIRLSSTPLGKKWQLANEISMYASLLPPPEVPPVPKLARREAGEYIMIARNEALDILKQNPSHVSSRRLLGDIALAHRDFETAAQYYTQIADDPMTENNRGVLACLQERWAEARQRFENCSEANGTAAKVASYNLRQLQTVRR